MEDFENLHQLLFNMMTLEQNFKRTYLMCVSQLHLKHDEMTNHSSHSETANAMVYHSTPPSSLPHSIPNSVSTCDMLDSSSFKASLPSPSSSSFPSSNEERDLSNNTTATTAIGSSSFPGSSTRDDLPESLWNQQPWPNKEVDSSSKPPNRVPQMVTYHAPSGRQVSSSTTKSLKETLARSNSALINSLEQSFRVLNIEDRQYLLNVLTDV